MKQVAINGLGRIGRLLLRRYLEKGPGDVTLVAVNDPMPAQNLVYLLKYDSVHGRAQFDIRVAAGKLWLNDQPIHLFAETDPERLPWKKLGVDLVFECSGHFRKKADAGRHLFAGAKRVIVSAPSADADVTLVAGVNEQDFNPEKHFILSNASCTTHSLAPVLRVLDEQFKIRKVLVTTIHAYTSSQNLVDVPAGKHERGRAGAINIIPTATGAETATIQVLPQLEGKISALAVRVPVANGSLTDISVEVDKTTTVSEVNQALQSAAESQLKGILEYSEDELVSGDILGNPHSAIVHALSTRVLQGNFIKAQIWYDNEYGYACRCLDLLKRLPL